MPVLYSPRTVTNGLVLYLDAGNSKSYPGIGSGWTPNRLNKPMNSAGDIGSLVASGAPYPTASIVPGTKSANCLKFVTVTAPTAEQDLRYSVPFVAGKLMRISFWYKTENWSNGTLAVGFGIYNITGGGQGTAINSVSINGDVDWTFFDVTFTVPANSDGTGYVDIPRHWTTVAGQITYIDELYIGDAETIYDISGNGNHGTLVNTEFYNGYLRNTGNTSGFMYMTIPHSTSLNSALAQVIGGWSIEEVIWTNSVTYPEADAGSCVSTTTRVANQVWFDWNHAVGPESLRFEQAGGGAIEDTSVPIPSPYRSLNTWRVRTLVWNRTTNQNSVYINGVFIGSVGLPLTSGLPIYDGGGLTLGALYGWKHYGRRSTVKIYNRVLTSDEVLQNFKAARGRYGL